jgi:hypothetical protein
MQFEPTLEFTSNRAYHAAAILFFLHPDLPVKFPAVKDAIHAGWMTTFKHPMNYDELRRPPCVGASAYSEEEQSWCTATIQFLVNSLNTAGRQSRGIAETAASRRISGRVSAPRATAAAPAAAPAAASAAGVRRRRNEDRGDIEDVETDNETGQPSQSKRPKKQSPKARYPVFGVF